MEKTLEKMMKFSIGSIGYSLLELLWRGYTHWSMMITGGFLLCSLSDMFKGMGKRSILYKALCGAFAITITEFIVGIVTNKVFKMDVWDYSAERFNVLGQICLKYFLLWGLLSVPTIFCIRGIDKGMKILLPKGNWTSII